MPPLAPAPLTPAGTTPVASPSAAPGASGASRSDAQPGTLVARLRPLATFCLIGLANTGVSYAVYLAALAIWPYAVANAVGWCVGLLFSFWANCRFTWRVRPTWTRLVRFPLSSLPNLVFSTAGVVFLVEGVGVGQRVAPLLATAAAIPLSYLLARAILTRGATRP